MGLGTLPIIEQRHNHGAAISFVWSYRDLPTIPAESSQQEMPGRSHVVVPLPSPIVGSSSIHATGGGKRKASEAAPQERPRRRTRRRVNYPDLPSPVFDTAGQRWKCSCEEEPCCRKSYSSSDICRRAIKTQHVWRGAPAECVCAYCHRPFVRPDALQRHHVRNSCPVLKSLTNNL